MNKIETSFAEKMIKLADWRPFSMFLHSSSLNSATLFMSSKYEKSETAQLNAINLCRHYHETNNSKPTQQSIVSIMYKNAVYAIKEEEIFCDSYNAASGGRKCMPFMKTC